MPLSPVASNRASGIFPGIIKVFLLLFVTVNLAQVFGQDTPEYPVRDKKEKTEPEAEAKPHSITRAAVYSAVLPGLGQAYNRKYWKIPIIYAGFGVIGYFIYSNTQDFNQYKEAYVYTANGETYETDNPLVGRYNANQLKEGMDFYKRNRDLSYIVGAVWYIANVLEAYVDAHFFDYDISDDLSMKVSPSAVTMPAFAREPAPGIKVTLKF
jgi:hypothetical protein